MSAPQVRAQEDAQGGPLTIDFTFDKIEARRRDPAVTFDIPPEIQALKKK